jgi:hypothetical protein
MGGASSRWFDKSKRKILILSFEEENLASKNYQLKSYG